MERSGEGHDPRPELGGCLCVLTLGTIVHRGMAACEKGEGMNQGGKGQGERVAGRLGAGQEVPPSRGSHTHRGCSRGRHGRRRSLHFL